MTAINHRRSVAGETQPGIGAIDAAAPPRGEPLWQLRYSRVLVITDTAAVLGAMAAALTLRFGFPAPGSHPNHEYLKISLAIAVAWLASLSINNSRSHRVVGTGAEEYRRVCLGTMWVFGGTAIVSMLLKLEIARGYLVIALPVGLFLLVGSRWFARRIIARERRRYGHCVTRVLVVGSPTTAIQLAAALARDPGCGYQVSGIHLNGPNTPKTLQIPRIGSVPAFGAELCITDAVLTTKSHAVAVAPSEQLHGSEMREVSWELEKLNVDLLVAPGVIDVAGPRLHMRPIAGLPLIHVEKPSYHGAKRFQKRLFDVGFAGAIMLLSSPLLAVVGLAVKLTSKGSVFYRQERVGLDGQPFEMVKFRTMVDGADQMLDEVIDLNEFRGGVLFKARNDPRVTPVGRFMRKYSLDELPQFINVLRGDMSVVGPRPPLATEVESYSHDVRRRLLVRPGITGLWQISGRSDLSWEDSVRLDLYYVENWSMMADILIAFKTAKAVLSHDGAY